VCPEHIHITDNAIIPLKERVGLTPGGPSRRLEVSVTVTVEPCGGIGWCAVHVGGVRVALAAERGHARHHGPRPQEADLDVGDVPLASVVLNLADAQGPTVLPDLGLAIHQQMRCRLSKRRGEMRHNGLGQRAKGHPVRLCIGLHDREYTPVDVGLVPPSAPAESRVAGEGTDGNTVVFTAPDGLIVVDTGRPAWHSDGILAFAAERRQRVRAIVNTHWHLDHASGNGRIKAAHPEARSRLPSEAASPSITIPARLQSAQAHRGGARYARLTGGTP
jgi:hypothetical protein